MRVRRVAGGAERFAGIGPRPFEAKDQGKADADLVRHLAQHEGMTDGEAWALVAKARDPSNPEHETAKATCADTSKRHRLGWYPADSEAGAA